MLLFDTHADTLYRRVSRPGAQHDITPDKLRAGGVTGPFPRSRRCSGRW